MKQKKKKKEMLNPDHGSQLPPIPAAPTPGNQTGLEARCCGTSGTCWQFCCLGVTILCRLRALPLQRWLQTSPNLPSIPQPAPLRPDLAPCECTNCPGQIASVKTAPSAAGMEKHTQLGVSLLLTELKSCQQNRLHLSVVKPKCWREAPSATAPPPQCGAGSAGAAPSPEPNVGEGGTEGGDGAG